MKMKKLTALVLALVMVLSLSVAAWADTTLTSVTDPGNTDSHGVFATYDGTGTSIANTKYKVVISWGALAFKYTVDTSNTDVDWDPDTHTYVSKTNGGYAGTWSTLSGNEEDAKVTLTNHSNAAVKASFAFDTGKYNSVTASLKEDTANTDLVTNGCVLTTAVGTEVENAPSVTGTVSLTGDLPTGANNTKIFTLTVTLSSSADIT